MLSEITLGSIGEAAIIQRLVSKYTGAVADERTLMHIGDDAAVLQLVPGAPGLVLTIDQCPTPVTDLLGVGSMYDWGRMAGVISLSDLAAMGAQPLAMLSSTSMPADMKASEYEGFLQGLNDVCSDHATAIVGGNIRESDRFSATTVAIGTVEAGHEFSRDRASAGDVLVVVGSAGLFWSAVLAIRSGLPVSDLHPDQHSALFHPLPRLQESLQLASLGHVTAAIDCSDGLGGGIATLARSSSLGAVIDFNSFDVHPSVRVQATDNGIPLERILLAWGDWQLVVAAPPDATTTILSTLTKSGTPCFVAGRLTADPAILAIDRGGDTPTSDLDLMDSTRFESSSYLWAGIDPYVRRLQGEGVESP